MGLRIRKSVFIASTLPLKLSSLFDHLSDAELIVCASHDLRDAIQETLELVIGDGHGVTIRVVSNKGIRRFPEIWLLVLRSRQIVTTHECAWPSLDLSIVLLRRLTTSLKATDLKGMRKISLWAEYRQVRDGSVAGRGFVKGIVSSFNFLARLMLSPIFEYYSGVGIDGTWRAWKVRDSLVRENSYSPPSTPRATAKMKLDDGQRPLIVLAVSLPSADQFNVQTIFLNAVKIILDMGYRCWVKDHPRKEQRLGEGAFSDFSQLEGFNYVNPAIPMEVLTTTFNIIGIVATDSAALVTKDAAAISLLSLIDMPEERRLLVRDYLEGFNAEHSINFVETWFEFRRSLAQC